MDLSHSELDKIGLRALVKSATGTNMNKAIENSLSSSESIYLLLILWDVGLKTNKLLQYPSKR